MQQSPKHRSILTQRQSYQHSHKSAAISHSDTDISVISVFLRLFVQFSDEACILREKDWWWGLYSGAHVRVGRSESTRTLVALDVRDLHPFIRPVKVKSQGSLGQAKEDLPSCTLTCQGSSALLPIQPRARAEETEQLQCVCVLLKILQV